MRKKLSTISNIVRLIGSHLSELESQHWIAGDRALALRDDEQLGVIGSQGTLVAHYWRAVSLYRAGLAEEASDTLRRLVAVAPSPLQAKALVTLGGIHLSRGDYGGAEYLYAQARRTVGDPITALWLKRMQGVLLSITGQHRSSLDEMERALPLLGSIAPNHPSRLDFYNSCAVELIAVGRTEVARPLVQAITASPLINLYPEWMATAQELPPKPSPLPLQTPGHPQLEPARILPFPDRPVESEELRQARAVTVACTTRSKLAVGIILKVENASEDRLQICSDLLDAEEPNAQLAAWASKTSFDQAAIVLRFARKTADEDKQDTVRQLKPRS